MEQHEIYLYVTGGTKRLFVDSEMQHSLAECLASVRPWLRNEIEIARKAGRASITIFQYCAICEKSSPLVQLPTDGWNDPQLGPMYHQANFTETEARAHVLDIVMRSIAQWWGICNGVPLEDIFQVWANMERRISAPTEEGEPFKSGDPTKSMPTTTSANRVAPAPKPAPLPVGSDEDRLKIFEDYLAKLENPGKPDKPDEDDTRMFDE